MINEIMDALDCPEFFLERSPRGFFELIYDDGETDTEVVRVYVDSYESMSVSNWISLGRSFISKSKSKSSEGTLLH